MSILVASIGAQASVSPPGKSYIMTSSQQEMLRKAWLEGRHGNLCALSEAMLWAVREVWRAEKRSLHGLQTFAAGLVTKVGTGEHPTHRAVGLFYARVDADPEWYPGKSGQVIHGPAKALTSQQASAIARSAQVLKARGVEPTYSRIVSDCPNATLNHKTGKAVDKKRVYDVFRASCRDEGGMRTGSTKQGILKLLSLRT